MNLETKVLDQHHIKEALKNNDIDLEFEEYNLGVYSNIKYYEHLIDLETENIDYYYDKLINKLNELKEEYEIGLNGKLPNYDTEVAFKKVLSLLKSLLSDLEDYKKNIVTNEKELIKIGTLEIKNSLEAFIYLILKNKNIKLFIKNSSQPKKMRKFLLNNTDFSDFSYIHFILKEMGFTGTKEDFLFNNDNFKNFVQNKY